MLQNLFKSQEKIIAEIHCEFDSAEDRLLQEAKAIIAKGKDDDKAKRMEALGFLNAERVVSFRKQQKPLVESKQQAELIEYYKQNYPFQKFLTEAELDRICEKYGLIHAPVANYLKDVPEKNLREIERVNVLNESDKQENLILFKITGFYFGMKILCSHIPELFKLDESTLKKYLAINYSSGKWDCLNKFLQAKYNVPEYVAMEHAVINIDRSGLFIAAPPSHFNTEKLKKNGKHGFFSFIQTEVKDPIVFRYCRGGVQVISKWGLEASDELLTNPIEN